MEGEASVLSALKKAVLAFFRHDVVLHRDDEGVHLCFEDRKNVQPRPPTRAQRAAQKDRAELERSRQALAALLDVDATLRSGLRQLAFVEYALEKKGWRGLHKIPLDVLQKALEQLEQMVQNWSDEGLACLRSKMAVAVIDREHMDPNKEPEAYKTAALLENPPTLAARAISAAKAAPAKAESGIEVSQVDDGDALLAAYAALGLPAEAEPSDVELHGELDSPSAKALVREARRGAVPQRQALQG